MATHLFPEKGYPMNGLVAIRKQGGDYMVVKVLGKDVFTIQINESSLAASGTSDFTEVSQLNPVVGEFLQVLRIGLRGEVVVRISQPAGTRRLGTDKSSNGGTLTQDISPIGNEVPVNYITLEQNSLQRRIDNNYIQAVSASLRYTGYRYSYQLLVNSIRDLDKWRVDNDIRAPISIGGAGFC